MQESILLMHRLIQAMVLTSKKDKTSTSSLTEQLKSLKEQVMIQES